MAKSARTVVEEYKHLSNPLTPPPPKQTCGGVRFLRTVFFQVLDHFRLIRKKGSQSWKTEVSEIRNAKMKIKCGGIIFVTKSLIGENPQKNYRTTKQTTYKHNRNAVAEEKSKMV